MRNAKAAGTFIVVVLVAGSALHGSTAPDPAPYERVLDEIAAAIERLKPRYPQLTDFSSDVHRDRSRLAIEYAYKTHEPARRGGWTSSVPNPDGNGVWFYIDFHDPDSQAQIHRQPVVPRYRYRDMEMMFLILEGEETDSLRDAVVEILRDAGATPGRNPALIYRPVPCDTPAKVAA